MSRIADQTGKPMLAPAGLPDGIDPQLLDTLERMAQVFADIAHRIARGGIDEDLAGAKGTNSDGDAQKALDVIADNAFQAALVGGFVRHYASEEQDVVLTITPGAGLALAIDPLDGSSNIDSNVTIGTIFGIYPAAADGLASFLRPGRELLAAGYATYGPQCCIVVTFGAGVLKLVLDPDLGQFVLVNPAMKVPADSKEYAINASNYRHWPSAIRRYVDDRVAGADGPSERNFNMRWIASLVAETHRILTRGGIFLYPRDARPGYENGRLRLVYECAPIALLIEQAGGRATDGVNRILDAVPDQLHARIPLIFGSAEKVGRVAAYFDGTDTETSALFGKRGLFRS